jgi:parallel beta-helix repeat protein
MRRNAVSLLLLILLVSACTITIDVSFTPPPTPTPLPPAETETPTPLPPTETETPTPVPPTATETPTEVPPTPTPTLTPTATDTPFPTPTPELGGIQLNPGDNYQAIVNSYPAGSAFLFTTGVHQRVSIRPRNNDVFQGQPGAILDGMNDSYKAFSALDQPNSSTRPTNVTIRYLEIRNYISHTSAENSSSPEGAIEGAEGWVIESNYIHHNKAGISLGKGNWGWGDGAIIRNNTIVDNGEIGVEINGSNILFEGNELARNGFQLSNNAADWMGAATKFTDQGVWADNTYSSFIHRSTTRGPNDHLIIRGNHSHHNNGMGIWLDVFNQNAIIEDNLVEYNRSSGIFDELSTGTIIRNNTVRYNRLNNTNTGVWGGGEIFAANSKDGLVTGNLIIATENGRGVMLTDESYRTPRMTNYRIDGNDITYQGSPQYGANIYSPIAGMTGGGGNSPFQTSGNVFLNNTYRLPAGSSASSLHFYWDGGMSWASWRAAGHDLDGQLILP